MNNSSHLTEDYSINHKPFYNIKNLNYLIPKRDIKIYKEGILVNEGPLTNYSENFIYDNDLFFKDNVYTLGDVCYVSILPGSLFYRINQSTSQGLLDYHEKNFTSVCNSGSQTWLSYYNRIGEFLDERRGGNDWNGKQYLSCYTNIYKLNFINLCNEKKNSFVYKLIKKTNLGKIIEEESDLKIISLFYKKKTKNLYENTKNLFKFCFGCWNTNIKEQYKILLLLQNNLLKNINLIINKNINNLDNLIFYLNNNPNLYKNKDIIDLIGQPSLNNLTTLDEIIKFRTTYYTLDNKKIINQRLSIYRFDQLASLILCKLTNDYNFNGWYYPNIKSCWIKYNVEEFVILGMYKYFKKEKPNKNIKKLFSILKKNILGQKFALTGKLKKKSKKKTKKNNKK